MSSGQGSRDEFENWVAKREKLGDHENWLSRPKEKAVGLNVGAGAPSVTRRVGAGSVN